MNRTLLLAMCTLAGVALLQAQTQGQASAQMQAPSYKVIFDLTSHDSLDQRAVVRWIKEITAAPFPAQEVEVVMYGKGLELVMADKSHFVPEVQEAIKHTNVSFRVCQIAMRNSHVEKNQLMDGVQTVPDGIYELVSKQREGWGYIKVSH